jgi:hypothetical protein
MWLSDMRQNILGFMRKKEQNLGFVKFAPFFLCKLSLQIML